jgi:hypothetical protein
VHGPGSSHHPIVYHPPKLRKPVAVSGPAKTNSSSGFPPGTHVRDHRGNRKRMECTQVGHSGTKECHAVSVVCQYTVGDQASYKRYEDCEAHSFPTHRGHGR